MTVSTVMTPLPEAAALLTLGRSSDRESWSLLQGVASNGAAHVFLQQAPGEAIADRLLRGDVDERCIDGLTPEAAATLAALVSASEPALGERIRDRLA